MPIDPIELRLGNLFEYRNQVLELSERDIQDLPNLLPELKPILITGIRLSRLNFTYIGRYQAGGLHWQRYENGIYFNLYQQKDQTYQLYLNDEIRLNHINYIHQLQNIYYDLTGDVLKRPEPGKQVIQQAPQVTIEGFSKSRSGPGKYRSKKD